MKLTALALVTLLVTASAWGQTQCKLEPEEQAFKDRILAINSSLKDQSCEGWKNSYATWLKENTPIKTLRYDSFYMDEFEAPPPRFNAGELTFKGYCNKDGLNFTRVIVSTSYTVLVYDMVAVKRRSRRSYDTSDHAQAAAVEAARVLAGEACK